MRDVVVCHSVPVGILISTAVRDYGLVSIGILIVWFRILEDDVPRVEKTGKIS
jgi:hypothetical protein